MIRILGLLVALLAGSAPLVSAAQTPPPDPAALFALERAAVGGAAWDSIAEIIESGAYDGQGFKGPYASYVDARTGHSKAVLTLAGTTQAQGYDARGAWSQQETLVQPVEDAAAVATARTNAYVARNGWWHPQTDAAAFTALGVQSAGGVQFDVVRVVPQGGNAIDVWIDANTHRIAKTVQKDAANVTTTTSYSDYRRVDGVLYPFATLTSIGDPKYDQHTAVQSVRFSSSVSAADLTRPENQPTGTIAGGDATTIPFEMDDPSRGHIIVKVRVNGSRPLNMIFDTGGSNVVTPEIAKLIGLRGTGAMAAGGAGESQVSIQIASGATLQIGNATMREQQFGIFPLPVSLVYGNPRRTVDGIIGYEVLKNFVVSIDYVHRTMTLAQPKSFRYRGGGTAVTFKSATIPVIPVSFDGAAGAFMVDTGNAFYNTVSQGFVRANRLEARLPGAVLVQSSGNIGGALRTRLVRAAAITIGPFTIVRPVFAVTDTKSGALAGSAFSGNIGEPILSRFDLTFDYAHDTIYMQPNANFSNPYRGTLDGMSVFRPDARTLEVAFVNPGSPAAKAGLRAGDTIVALAGAPAGGVGSDDLAVLETSKAVVELTYRRGAATHVTRIVPAEMVP